LSNHLEVCQQDSGGGEAGRSSKKIKWEETALGRSRPKREGKKREKPYQGGFNERSRESVPQERKAEIQKGCLCAGKEIEEV